MIPTIRDDELQTLDAYDQGRIDTNERFIRILQKGILETNSRMQLINFLMNELGLPVPVTEGTGNEQI